MLSNEKRKLTNKEIIEMGSRALIKELGYSGFLRFLRCTECAGKDDYLETSDGIFDNMSLNEIYENAKNYWEKTK